MTLPHAQTTAKKIQQLKIQGASKIAEAALGALVETIHSSKSSNSSALLSEIRKSASILSSARPTEPYLYNCMSLALADVDEGKTLRELKTQLLSRIAHIHEQHRRDHHYIAELISRKIPHHGTVFTHCHSNTVVAGLLLAWKRGTRFTVHNTESRPLYQGRITAQQLCAKGIPLIHWPDSAAMEAIHQCDIALFGSDSILTNGVANKIGTRLLCHTSRRHDVPTYICTHSLKFDSRSLRSKQVIEERSSDEVWPNAPRGVRVMNPAFDIVEEDAIDGIISEHGVLTLSTLISQLRSEHPWLFEKKSFDP